MSEVIKARHSLVEGLEKIIQDNRTAIATSEAQKTTISARKLAMEAKKREVEDGIMRGIISAESTPMATYGSPGAGSNSNGNAASPSDNEPERPDVEELTPPPESNPPEGEHLSPTPGAIVGLHGDFDHRPTSIDPRLASRTLSAPSPAYTNTALPVAGADLLSSLSVPSVHQFVGNHGATPKKRKIDDDYTDFAGGEDAMANLDDDVAELLRAESGGR